MVALVGAVYQLHQSRVAGRESRAHQYLERYNEPGEIPYIVRTQAFISLKGAAAADRIKEWEGMDHTQKLETLHALNFWEELAGMYNRKQVDRRIVSAYFGPTALWIWTLSLWFTTYQRGLRNPRVMDEMEKMCDDIRRLRHGEDRSTWAQVLRWFWVEPVTRAGRSGARPTEASDPSHDGAPGLDRALENVLREKGA